VSKTIELAEQTISVTFGVFGQLLNEFLNLFPAGLPERLGAAEVDGIGLYQFRVELVPADDLAKTVADLGTSTVAVRVLWRELLAGIWNGPDFLDRANADAVGLTQGAIDGSRFGHAHLGTTNEEGDIGRIGVTIANKSFAIAGFKDCGFECPSRCTWIGKFSNALYMYSSTLSPLSNSQETRVAYVPAFINIKQIA
jgi:hypothetical protein